MTQTAPLRPAPSDSLPETMPRCALAWLTLAVLVSPLAGCGEGLMGEDEVSDLTGLGEFNVPLAPAWVVRWMLDGETLDGPVQAVDYDDVFMLYEAEDEDTYYEYVDFLEVLGPAISSPPAGAIRYSDAHAYAVGVPMLLDDLDGDGEHQPPSGVDRAELWGVSSDSVLLYVDGDLGAMAAEQPVGLEILSEECDCVLEIEPGLNNTLVEFDVLDLWWEREEVAGDDEPFHVLWPDHATVVGSDHDGAFVVVDSGLMDDWFSGGIEAYLGPAWWAWFTDDSDEDGGAP